MVDREDAQKLAQALRSLPETLRTEFTKRAETWSPQVGDRVREKTLSSYRRGTVAGILKGTVRDTAEDVSVRWDTSLGETKNEPRFSAHLFPDPGWMVEGVVRDVTKDLTELFYRLVPSVDFRGIDLAVERIYKIAGELSANDPSKLTSEEAAVAYSTKLTEMEEAFAALRKAEEAAGVLGPGIAPAKTAAKKK
jgi:hypothetical protein